MAASLEFSENQILLNPLLPQQDLKDLTELAQKGFRDLNLKNHVALATSGTTRLPGESQKIVFLSEEALMTSAASVNQHLNSQQTDIWCSHLPLFHVGGLGILLRAKLRGGVVQLKQSWDPVKFSDFLKLHKVTLTSLVPTQLYDLVEQKISAPQSLRATILGGAALSKRLYQKAIELGWPILPSYGMTETCSQIATADMKELFLKQMPLPSLLSHAKVIEKESRYFIESKSLLTCYGQIRSGKYFFWDPKDSDGHLRVEDQINLHGNKIEVLGRPGDYFKISGESFQLSQLQEVFEQVLSEMKISTKDFYLTFQQDSRTGHEVVLYTAATGPIETICDRFKERVLPVAKIRKVFTVDSIPRTSLGKVEIQLLKGKAK